MPPGNLPETSPVIDAHAHCGVIDRSWPQSLADYARQAAGTDIGGVALFSPVMEIYDRHDPRFVDTTAWRRRRQASNAHLLSLHPCGLRVYPYFFIWNDFAVEQFTDAHCGIKWHRHAGEPVYHYDDPRCRLALDAIRRRRLPVILEEELANTVRFIRELAEGITVIIPHLGMLNGGYRAIDRAGLWAQENVWADTALADRAEIQAYLEANGHGRLMFGSDFPFGDPGAELLKIRSLGLDAAVAESVLGGNFLRLQAKVRHRDALDPPRPDRGDG